MDLATVEQLLMRQYMTEMKGAKRMQRVVQSVIGKEEQCKCDAAPTRLYLEVFVSPVTYSSPAKR